MTAAQFVGAGIGYRRAHRAALLAAGDGPRPPLLEVIPEHFFAAPAELDALAAVYPLVFHATDLSPGTATTSAVGEARLARVRQLARQARPLLVSEHLAMSVAPGGIELGHFLPLPHTEAALAVVSERVRRWQDLLEVPIALENIARPFTLPGAAMSEAEFLARLVEQTGCGLLLDLTNLVYNARNEGREPRVADYPLHAVLAIHLAGGFRRATDGYWVDSHSAPVEPESLALLRALGGGRTPRLRAIVVERDARLPSLQALTEEARAAGELWRSVAG